MKRALDTNYSQQQDVVFVFSLCFWRLPLKIIKAHQMSQGQGPRRSTFNCHYLWLSGCCISHQTVAQHTVLQAMAGTGAKQNMIARAEYVAWLSEKKITSTLPLKIRRDLEGEHVLSAHSGEQVKI